MEQIIRSNNHVILTSRKIREIKMRLLRTIVLFTVIVAAVSVVLVCGKLAGANENNEQVKYYKSIEIQGGDTLWSIASEYKDCHYSSIKEYISEIMSINNLNSDMINEGQKLLVCYYAEEGTR